MSGEKETPALSHYQFVLTNSRLRTKVRVPYQSLQANVTKLERIQQANDILRRMSRFVILTRRLELQLTEMSKGEGIDVETPTMAKGVNGSPRPADGASIDPTHGLAGELEDEKERVITKAALTVAELSKLHKDVWITLAFHCSPSRTSWHTDLLLDNAPPEAGDAPAVPEEHKIPLSSIKTVAAHLPFIESARTRISSDMENMIMTGLADLVGIDCIRAVAKQLICTPQNQSLIASSLQTAHNLRVLPLLVQQLVSDLSETVEGRIKYAFDMSRISKEVLAKGRKYCQTCSRVPSCALRDI